MLNNKVPNQGNFLTKTNAIIMYKFLEFDGKKYPIRISNTVLGEWQEETGKTSVANLKDMSFKDVRVLLTCALKAGYRFAKKEFDVDELQIELMVDDQNTVEAFLKLIPEFFPGSDKDAKVGKKKAPAKQ